MLLDAFNDNSIDEDEFVLLYNLNTSKNPVLLHEIYERFELANVYR